MYRILIVDDEALVRHGITKSVNWNELDIEMVAEAENGVEAFEQVLENVPDVILLDICMPRMDGLEFASIIKKKYPQVKVVIITGFDDFEYARSALRMGVDDYILKPITKEMVERVVKNQLAKIEEERGKQETIHQDDVKAAAILNSILKQDKRAAADIPLFCGYTEMQNQDVYFVLMKDYLSGCKIWDDEISDELARFSILNIAGELLQNEKRGFAFETYKNELAMLVCAESRMKMDDILMEIYQNLLSFLEIPVDFAVSEVAEIGGLAAMAEQAREALRYAFILSGQNVIYYSDIKERASEGLKYPEHLEKLLLEAMYGNDAEQSRKLIEAFFVELKELMPGDDQCRSMLLRLFLKISNTIESVDSRLQSEEGQGIFTFDPVGVVEGFDSPDEAEEWLKELYKKLASYVSNMKSRSGQLFLKIRQYIEKNYAKNDLNLKKCSEDLFLSSGYISMILKKESGKTFVDYLNEYRIQKATELLAYPDSKVYEVATETGFMHQTYFSSVFKKIMGISPRQFKEQS